MGKIAPQRIAVTGRAGFIGSFLCGRLLEDGHEVQFDPVQTTKTSVHGAINMLGLAKRTKAKVLQASTSEVYGHPAEHPPAGGILGQRESDWPARLL